MNILITGSNGFIGTELIDKLSGNSEYNLYKTNRNTLNMLDKKSVDEYFNQNKIDMEVSVFREDLQLPYSLGFTHKPDNDSKNTLKELNYLAKLKTNEDLVKERDEVFESFKPLVEKNNVSINLYYLDEVIKDRSKYMFDEFPVHEDYNHPKQTDLKIMWLKAKKNFREIF